MSNRTKGRFNLTTVRHPEEELDDIDVMVRCVGRLYAEGVDVDWAAFYEGERRHRLPLPTYPFQRERYWEENTVLSADTAPPAVRSPQVEDWVSTPTWQRALPPAAATAPETGGTLLHEDVGLCGVCEQWGYPQQRY